MSCGIGGQTIQVRSMWSCIQVRARGKRTSSARTSGLDRLYKLDQEIFHSLHDSISIESPTNL
jgi:hypothetical protein